MFRWKGPSGGRVAALALLAGHCLAHDEWHGFHIVYSARTSFTYPFDGRTPKVATALLNHHPTAAPPTVFTLTVNGAPPAAAGFSTFPDGGVIQVGPDAHGLASALTAGVYDGAAGPAPQVGEAKEYTFQFVFALAPGAIARPGTVVPTNPDPANNNDPAGTTTARVRFTNLGDNPVLAGPLHVQGTLRFAGATAGTTVANVRIEVSTPYSGWFPVPATAGPAAGAPTYAFSQSLPARDDWHLRFSADGYATQMRPVGFVNDPRPAIAITLRGTTPPAMEYRRAVAVGTPTGFWRGAASESEGTFVAFPGQEKWPVAASLEEDAARRAASRLYKYRFDGTRRWEHAPGQDTLAGDMSRDGRFVAYAINPLPRPGWPGYVPFRRKLVLLDGATGAVLWTREATANVTAEAALFTRIGALELVFSADARWIAIGGAEGAVTLVDRATGDFAWTTSAEPSFGQVRKLRFSANGEFLFCGSGDSTIRKLRVSDGAVLWRIFAGGWPHVNGLDLTPDGEWLVAGTQSLDTTLVRTSDGFLQWQRESQYVDALFSPDGRHVVTAGGQIYRTLDGSLAGMTKRTGVSRFAADGRSVVQLERDLRVYDLGGKLLSASEPAGWASPGALPQWGHLSANSRYAILLGRDLATPGETGIVIYERRMAAGAAAPTLTAAPEAQSIVRGGSATFRVEAEGTAPLGYVWRKDGVVLADAVGPTLAVAAAANSAGEYQVTVANAAGAVTRPFQVTLVEPDAANPPRLSNLAVRARVGPAPLIVGFSLGGARTGGQKPVLVRAAGPSLVALGVEGFLRDPELAIFSGATRVAENKDWAGNSDVHALGTRLGAFPFSTSASGDAAIATTAVGGSYTALVTSADGSSGTALAEIYDASSTFLATTPRLVNVSARTEAGAAGETLTAGFVIAGPAGKTVLIRGVGPALAAFGVANALADPRLDVFAGNRRIATNDNWYDAPNAVAVATASAAAGAFTLPTTSRDSAILMSLPPGSYTAQLSAADGAVTGNALVEVYDVP